MIVCVCCFRYLYWGQGANKAGIFRCDLDGGNTIDVATTVVEQPTGMTLGEWKQLIIVHSLCVCLVNHELPHRITDVQFFSVLPPCF